MNPDVQARLERLKSTPIDGQTLKKLVEAGLTWLRANVHGKGSIESTDEVLVEATGDRLGTAAFKAHLETRYLSA